MTKHSSPSSPGVAPHTLANIAAVSIGGSSDPSQDLLIFLALAINAASQLQEMGVDLGMESRKLALDAAQQAYREALYLRSKRVPPEYLDTKLITRHGRLVK